MPNRFDDDDDDVARLRIALARIARVVDRTSAEDGMTRTQLSVLGTIVRLNSVGMSELAEFEGLNPTMLSRIVGKLEAAGLVTRAPSAEDRRVIAVQTTPDGRALHLRLRRKRSRLFAERLVELPDGRAAELLGALPALEALAEQMHNPGKQDAIEPTAKKTEPDAKKPAPAKVGAAR